MPSPSAPRPAVPELARLVRLRCRALHSAGSPIRRRGACGHHRVVPRAGARVVAEGALPSRGGRHTRTRGLWLRVLLSPRGGVGDAAQPRPHRGQGIASKQWMIRCRATTFARSRARCCSMMCTTWCGREMSARAVGHGLGLQVSCSEPGRRLSRWNARTKSARECKWTAGELSQRASPPSRCRCALYSSTRSARGSRRRRCRRYSTPLAMGQAAWRRAEAARDGGPRRIGTARQCAACSGSIALRVTLPVRQVANHGTTSDHLVSAGPQSSSK